MSTYLICSTPAHGHIVPLASIAEHLVGRGHRVRFLTSERYRERITGAGAELVPLPASADVDLDNATEAFPERTGLKGPAVLRFDMLNLMLRPGHAQFDALMAALTDVPTDAILAEPLFIGAALLSERSLDERPPVVALGIVPLVVRSRDVAPFGLGVSPMPGPLGRARNATLTLLSDRVIFRPVNAEAKALSLKVVGRPLSRPLFNWVAGAEAIVQFTVPGFEYPRSDLAATVHFVGPLPSAASTAEIPEWWHELGGIRPVVHVTQGTLANRDFGQLVEPAIAGLAGAEALVVVSTGGRPISRVAGPRPENVRIAEYLPYDRLLPLTDVMVTNGGYGGVQQALGHGVPLVVAGQTEDKVEVSARVAWSGVGINLRTNEPSAADVAAAVHTVLADDSYRSRARALAAEIEQAPGLGGLDEVLQDLELLSARSRRRRQAG